MDKIQFKKFCDTEFKKRNFIKANKGYYLNGDKGVLCGIFFQKSDFSDSYYINYYFFLGEFKDKKSYPICYDLDVQGRITVISKTETIKGEYLLTAAIEYEMYSEEELRPHFDKAFEEQILPPIYQGKKYILDNLKKLYFLTLRQDDVMQKLLS